jgi:glycosyltransferase involved in cell wall biosynthesis
LSQPKVTVVLAVKNEARFLKQTVADLLGQTYSNIHIIAIDDGSTDETASLLNCIPPRYK